MHADANIGTYRELIASRARIVAVRLVEHVGRRCGARGRFVAERQNSVNTERCVESLVRGQLRLGASQRVPARAGAPSVGVMYWGPPPESVHKPHSRRMEHASVHHCIQTYDSGR
jgi:hypothetical protein